MNLKRSEQENHRAIDCKHNPTIQEFGSKNMDVALWTHLRKRAGGCGTGPQIIRQKIRECRCNKKQHDIESLSERKNQQRVLDYTNAGKNINPHHRCICFETLNQGLQQVENKNALQICQK